MMARSLYDVVCFTWNPCKSTISLLSAPESIDSMTSDFTL